MIPTNFVSKGWGFEKWLVNKAEYCGKLLFFAKGKRCSLHYHKLKDETFYVHKGEVDMWYSDDLAAVEKALNAFGPTAIYQYLQRVTLKSGNVFPVPRGRVHQVIAKEDTEVFEFSTEHFDSDSYRLVKGD